MSELLTLVLCQDLQVVLSLCHFNIKLLIIISIVKVNILIKRVKRSRIPDSVGSHLLPYFADSRVHYLL